MTEADIEYLKSHIGEPVEIVTVDGERLLIKAISVFDEESDPDVFFWDITESPDLPDAQQTQGYSLPLAEIISVEPVK